MICFQTVALIRAKLLIVFGIFSTISAAVDVAAHFGNKLFDVIFAVGGTIVTLALVAYAASSMLMTRKLARLS